MGTTPIYGLPYPELANGPNIPADFRALAEATESAMGGSDRSISVLGLYKTSAAQAIPSQVPTSGWTLVTWPSTYLNTTDGELTLTSDEIVNTSGQDLIVAVTAAIGWQNNTTGARWMSLRKTVSGTPSYYASDPIQPGTNGIERTKTTLLALILEAGASLGVVCAQNSGGSLNVVDTLTSGGGPPNIFQVEVKGTV